MEWMEIKSSQGFDDVSQSNFAAHGKGVRETRHERELMMNRLTMGAGCGMWLKKVDETD